MSNTFIDNLAEWSNLTSPNNSLSKQQSSHDGYMTTHSVAADVTRVGGNILAVTGGSSIGECGRLSQPSWLLGAL